MMDKFVKGQEPSLMDTGKANEVADWINAMESLTVTPDGLATFTAPGKDGANANIQFTMITVVACVEVDGVSELWDIEIPGILRNKHVS